MQKTQRLNSAWKLWELVTSETIWQARNLAVLLDAVAAARRNLRKQSRNSSEAEAARAETKETTRSTEARRLWKSKRGVRVLEKAEKKTEEEDLDRRSDSSLSFRLWVAYDVRASSRMAAIFSINRFASSVPFSSMTFSSLTAMAKMRRIRMWNTCVDEFWTESQSSLLFLNLSGS